MTVSAEQYFAAMQDALRRVQANETEQIRRAATILAERMRSGGVVQVFGTGHSRAFCMELAGRAGGLVPMHAMYLDDLALAGRYPVSQVRDLGFERRPEIAHDLVDIYDIRAEDAFVVVSNSGRNGATVEMAQIALDRKLPLVVVTSKEHSRGVESRHPSGHRLFELGDVVIDNGAPFGDAVLSLGEGMRVCAVSSVTGAWIAQALTAEIVARYCEQGDEPPVLVSANLDGADDHNRALSARYGARIGNWGQ
jgi:uncharacterized phosphosugar-binding protein